MPGAAAPTIAEMTPTSRTEDQVFVGRRRELRVLRGLLDDAKSGNGVAAAIVGEPGIGKTRLLGELIRHAHTAGVTVLHGQGSELERDMPFGLAIGALDELAAGLEPMALKRLGDERVGELSAVLPSLAGQGRTLASPLEVERYRCHYAVRALLEQLAGEQPLLLVFDDVHWADQASLELLSYLLRRPVRRSLIAFALRRQAPARLLDAIDRATSEGAVLSLRLGSLSRSEAAELLGATFSTSMIDALIVESGGNPFYLEQLARLFRGRCSRTWSEKADLRIGHVDPPGPDAEVPPAVITAVGAELMTLSDRARLLAQAAAVAGEPFEIGFVGAIMDASRATVLAALDELITAEIVCATEAPGRFVFRHPIVRRAVHDSAGHGWRLGAHERAAQALDAQSAPISQRAHHVLHSGADVGDEAAIAVLTQAGHAAAPRAPASAAGWFSGALRLLPPNSDPSRRLALLSALASAFATIGRLAECRETLELALELVPRDDEPARLRIIHLIVRTLQELGQAAEARPLLDSALAQVDPRSTSGISLTLELAKNCELQRRWPAAIEAADRARELAQEAGEHNLFVAASAEGAFLRSKLNPEFSDVLHRLDQLTAELDQLSGPKVDSHLLDGVRYLVLTETTVERFESSARHCQWGLRLCRSIGNSALVVDFLHVLAVDWVFLGRLQDAREAAEAAVEGSRLLGADQTLSFVESTRSRVAAVQGDKTATITAGESGVKSRERVPSPRLGWHARISYGLALVELDLFAEGLAQLVQAGGPLLADVPVGNRPYYLRSVAEAQIALGQLTQAEATIRTCEAIAGPLRLNMRSGSARYARASLLLAKGDFAAAVEVAREGLARYEAARLPIEAARARLLLGRALIASGATAEAEHELTLAHATFQECGAARLADRAERELRQLGHRVARRPRRPNPGAGGPTLSDREWQVGELVAAGRTNREIADELYLSPKTVEAHLTRVFAKLGVRSRAAVAAEIERAKNVGFKTIPGQRRSVTRRGWY